MFHFHNVGCKQHKLRNVKSTWDYVPTWKTKHKEFRKMPPPYIRGYFHLTEDSISFQLTGV